MPDAFHIMADSTRRRLVEALRTGERSVSELVDSVAIGQPGVSRQLAILHEARFVVMRPAGRRRLYALRPEPFRELDQWLNGYRGLWEARLDRFGREQERRGTTRITRATALSAPGATAMTIDSPTSPTSATAGNQTLRVQSVTPCLAFNDRAEEAVNFYVSLFPNSRITSIVRSDGQNPVPAGKVLHATFELDGREFTAFDGGSTFSFNEGLSLMATCETQAELDQLWARLSAQGQEGPCGWLKDRFGVSWQVVPSALGQMLSDPTGGNSAGVMQALMQMGKLDIATLRQAYESPA